MIKVGIVGASGYSGVELVRILCRHPGVDLTVLTSRQYQGRQLAEIFANFFGRTELVFSNPEAGELAKSADFFFTAVPHKTAMDIVPTLLSAGKKVVDLSADFRLKDPMIYEEWYQPHTARQYIKEAVYGLPELYRDQIKKSRLIANPGCYPTSVILGLAPLLRAGVIDPASIVVDSKSGASGAGRAAQTGTLFCEVADGFRAYKVGEHRHTPEMEQEISLLCQESVVVSFTPHLLPISRGILSTIYAKLRKPFSQEEIYELYVRSYADEPFIRLGKPGFYPATQHVRGSNYCDLGFKVDERTGRIVVLSAIDNLVKGAAGQAVQNMNLMCGFSETQGLESVPLFP